MSGLLFALLAALPAFGRDELRFPNGDRISGKVMGQEAGKIRFLSEALGELEIPAQGVEVALDVPDSPVEALVGLPPIIEEKPAPTPEAARPAEATQVKPATPASIKPAALVKDAARWKGKLEAGLKHNSGRNDRIDLSLRGEMEKKIDSKNQLRLEGRLLYAEAGERIITDLKDGSIRWRRDVSPRMFLQAQSSAYADEVKQVDINAEQNIGLGYKLLDRDRHVLNFGAGVTGQYRESTLSEDGWAYLIEAFQDYTWRLNGRITVKQNASAYYSPPEFGTRNVLAKTGNSEVGFYRLRLNSTLQGKLTDRVSLNLRYEFEHDATIANPDLRDDQRITSSLGYAF